MFHRIPVHFNVTAVTIATGVTSLVVVTAVAYRDRGATLKEVRLTSDSKVVGLTSDSKVAGLTSGSKWWG